MANAEPSEARGVKRKLKKRKKVKQLEDIYLDREKDRLSQNITHEPRESTPRSSLQQE